MNSYTNYIQEYTYNYFWLQRHNTHVNMYIYINVFTYTCMQTYNDTYINVNTFIKSMYLLKMIFKLTLYGSRTQ
jgi:hypothetical protein